MNISQKKYKAKFTKVYCHSKKDGRIAIRVVGKYLRMFGFNKDDSVLLMIEKNKITLINKGDLHLI